MRDELQGRRLEVNFDKVADGVAAEDVFGMLEVVEIKGPLDARFFVQHLLAQDAVEQSTRQRWGIEDALELQEKIASRAFGELPAFVQKQFIENQSLPDLLKRGQVPGAIGGLVAQHRVKARGPCLGDLDAR